MTNNEFFFFQDTKGGFSPRSVSGLVTWINASNVLTSGANITQMTDLSGNNNHAVQSVGANRPSLVNNIIGGLPVARFTSGQHFTFIDNSLFPTGVTQFVVFKPANVAGNKGLFAKQDPSNMAAQFDSYLRNADNRAEYAFASHPTTNPISTANFSVLGAYASTTGHGYFVNALTQGTATGGSFFTGNVGNIYLGIRPAGNTNYIGDIAEALLFNRRLTDAEIIQISNFLMAKYAI